MAFFSINIPDDVNDLIKAAAHRKATELGARMPRKLFLENLIKAAAEAERKAQQKEAR